MSSNINTLNQLDDIHSMLSSGHRSFRLERHTLVLWGVAAAILILAIPALFEPELFDARWQRMLGQNSVIVFVLLGVGVLDFKLTRRARAQRNETVSFVQQQLTKVWWLLVGLAVVINIGMNFFGGGYIFLAVAMLITGIALYVQGLFSQQLLCWVGVMMIMLGLLSVALKIPHAEMQWLAASVFGLGLPAIGWLFTRPDIRLNMQRRLLVSVLWLAIVVAPALLAYSFSKNTLDPNLPILSLQQYRQSAEPLTAQVIRLPAGSVIPLHVQISGDVLEGTVQGTLDMKLSRNVELVVEDNKLEGRFRIDDGVWKQRLYNYRVRAIKRDMRVTKEEGIQANMHLRISTNN
ncbi:MAG: hypothetical protein ACC707_20145 [Thiohalomonadales bacterium]